jgi:hypothetical protein
MRALRIRAPSGTVLQNRVRRWRSEGHAGPSATQF